MLKMLIGGFILITALLNKSPDEKRSAQLEYIETYKEIAIAEMHRTGIPASITLGQAVHESQWGTSWLASNSNNHFGIKCKSYWKGMTFYHKDDDYDKNNNLIESCFRKYDTVLESYVDRSNFLKESSRYAELFTYERNDYKSWARGLQNCGYATDSNYANSLIRIIEELDLYEYDNAANPWFQTVKTEEQE